jgi:hypothetical protein
MKMFEPGCGFWYHGFSYCTTEARIFSRRARHFVHFVHFSAQAFRSSVTSSIPDPAAFQIQDMIPMKNDLFQIPNLVGWVDEHSVGKV